MPKYTPIIGVEIHVELKTNSKMFCSCKNEPDAKQPNIHICEICLAHPGTLPVPNKTAIEWTAKIGKALNCQITKNSKFDRKNYFYPDLPKGYQISQYDQPVGEHGYLDIALASGENHRDKAKLGVTRVHLEEDTAKLSHDNKKNSLVDFNRGGVPLVEIVSEPDMQSALEAKIYCQELQLIFRHLDVSNADMEKGNMRCEANVSLQEEGKYKTVNGAIEPIGDHKLNPKVELKNINSFKNIEKGIEYEIKRQTEMLEKGENWQQETRGWDDKTQSTVWQRTKETSADYRYFPEPDIPPFNPTQIAGKINLPELPQAKRLRFIQEFGFSNSDAFLLSSDKYWADYAEKTMSELEDWVANMPEIKESDDGVIEKLNHKNELARLAGGWLTSKLMGLMAERKIHIKILKLKAENFAELVCLIYAKRINSTNALKVLIEMLDSGVNKDPTHIMEERGLGQVSDAGKITKVIETVIKNHPKQVEQYKNGKEPLLKFLIGMVMKATEGSADPAIVEKLLKEKLQ